MKLLPSSKLDKLIYIIIFFCLSLFSYLIFKSVFFFEENRILEYKVYLIVLGLVILIFFFILSFHEKLKENILTLFFTLILLLYAAESAMLFGLLNIFNDYRSGFEAFNDEAKKFPKLVRTISPFHHVNKLGIDIEKNEILPLAGISNRQTMYCNENGYYTFFKSDRYGFRNPDNDENWNESIDYLIIGDSYAFGACLNNEDTFLAQISKNTQKKLLNLSYSANGPLLEFSTIQEYFNYVQKNNLNYPSKIVLIYAEQNDLWDLQKELKVSILKDYLNKNKIQNIFEKQEKIDLLLLDFFEAYYETEKAKYKNNFFNDMKNFIKLQKLRVTFIVRNANLKNRLIIQRQTEKGVISEKMLSDYDYTVSKLSHYLKKFDTELIFVYMPTYLRYLDPKTSEFYKKEEILKIIKKYNLEIIDLDEELVLIEEDPFSLFPFGNEGHFNEIGSIKASKIISSYLLN